MAESTHPPIVAGVDGSAASLDAVRWAARAAVRREAPLHLLHAADFSSLLAGILPPPEGMEEVLERRGHRYLRVARELAVAQGATEITQQLDAGRPAPALLETSTAAGLVVVGSSGHGQLTTVLAGSVAAAVAAHAGCDTVIVRGDTWDEPGAARRPIVVGVDGGSASAQVLAAAFAEARALHAPLVAVHAWADDPPRPEADPHMDWQSLEIAGRKLLAECIAEHEDGGVDVEQVVVRDHPRRELLDRSDDARLVVIGRRGRGGFPGLALGSTGQALLHHAACPVLIVRTESST